MFQARDPVPTQSLGGVGWQGVRARVPFFRVLLVSQIPDAFTVPELQVGEADAPGHGVT